MIDLVKALRVRAQRETSTGITEPQEHIDWMAADEITILRGQVEALNNERNRLWEEKLKEMSALKEAVTEIIRLREEKSILQQQLSNTNHCLEETQKENVRLKNTRGCGRCLDHPPWRIGVNF